MYYGGKGVIFTFDAVIAIFIIMLVLTASAFFLSNEQQPLVDLRTLRLGSDIITSLDNNNYLDNLSQNSLESNLTSLLPDTHLMKIKINCDSSSSLETSAQIPETGLVASGKRIFFIQSSRDYCTAQYWVWLK